ncbi:MULTISPECIES: MATE family efflux transporter [Caulobacter]|jgi:MATE family multidrug resistance protein|uniref:Multidrug-efflux transporter n=1 Tax=Caulobacter vibrioides OR37 TaxID=1292034 RepID=R0CZ46_CAUVI|nr:MULTISPECIES: MATE family efflux transporter [Caulobacter]ENZ81696.1 putative efflux protein, MATE family [Caulobacter vibrioides OR37]MBQ1560369.1 MATE family efflux transporter [Caulobacter sp.]
MPRDAAGAALSSRRPRGPITTDLIELLRLAGPVVLSRLGIMVMGLTDAIVVGHYSARQLGFHAMAWAPSSVLITMSIGLLVGVQVMTARAIGAGKPHETGAVLRRGLVYGAWIGVVGAVVLAAFGPLFLRGLGLKDGLAEGAAAPLIVFSLSLPVYALSVVLSFWLEGLARPGFVTIAMWVANAVNLAVNLLLVPGTLGLPALGAVGAAWSTFVARTFLTAALALYIARMKDARALGVFDKPARDRAAEAEQRKIGYGAGASNFFEVAAFAGMNLVAGWIGGLAVAAWAVVLNVAGIIFMVPLGVSTATAVQVGRAYGARDPAGMTRAGWIAFAVIAIVGLIAGCLLYPTRSWVALAYTSDPAARALILPALALTCLFLAPDAVQVVAAQALRARGEVWIPTITHLISYALVMGPLAWWLAIPRGMGLEGVVTSVIVTSFLSAGFLVARFRMLDWRDRRDALSRAGETGV